MENINDINREKEIKEYMDNLKKLDPSEIVLDELFKNDLFKESFSDKEIKRIYGLRNELKWKKNHTLNQFLKNYNYLLINKSPKFISTVNILVRSLGFKIKSFSNKKDLGEYNTSCGYNSKSILKFVKMDENEDTKRDLTEMPLDEVLLYDFGVKHDLNNRIFNVLYYADIKTLQDLVDCHNLACIKKLGDSSIPILSYELENYGYKIEYSSRNCYRFVKIEEKNINDESVEKIENEITNVDNKIVLLQKQKEAMKKCNELSRLLEEKTENKNKLQNEIDNLSKDMNKHLTYLKKLGYKFD